MAAATTTTTAATAAASVSRQQEEQQQQQQQQHVAATLSAADFDLRDDDDSWREFSSVTPTQAHAHANARAQALPNRNANSECLHTLAQAAGHLVQVGEEDEQCDRSKKTATPAAAATEQVQAPHEMSHTSFFDDEQQHQQLQLPITVDTANVATTTTTTVSTALVPASVSPVAQAGLDAEQRYAAGALCVLLLTASISDEASAALSEHELTELAFGRAYSSQLLSALDLSDPQAHALDALKPSSEELTAVTEQCAQLLGNSEARFLALQTLLACSVAHGVYDARARAFLIRLARTLQVPWNQVAAVELAVAMQLYAQEQEQEQEQEEAQDEGQSERPNMQQQRRTPGEVLGERRKRKQRLRRAAKVSGITLVGGILFGVTGGIIAPALLTALAGVGVAGAAGLAATGTVASGAAVGSLFGAAGAGITSAKARKRMSAQLEEFDFERPDDPRVVEENERRAQREKEREEKREAAKRLAEAARIPEKNLQISREETIERALPTPKTELDNSSDEEEAEGGMKKLMGKKRRKYKKLHVGPRGLEAAGQIPSLHITICVPGWLTERRYGTALRQFEDALKSEVPCSQHIALRWESRRLHAMGLAFAKFWASKATVTTIQQAYPHAVAAASSVAGAVAFAFALPLTVLSSMDYIDNPWSVLLSRSNGAAEELADVLIARSYGQRPVTLFGYSIGARVVFKCLESLASRGAHGIVDNAFLMSAPITADPERWKKVRPIVAGRLVNGYGTLDWALAYFHRGCGHGLYVSGLRRVDCEGVENLNLTHVGLEGHRELKEFIPRAMQAMGVGQGYIALPPTQVEKKRHSAAQASNAQPERLLIEYHGNGEDGAADPQPTDINGGPLGRPNGLTEAERRRAVMQDDAFWTSDAANDSEFGSEMHPSGKSVGAQKGRSRHNSSSEREDEDLWEDVEEERERENEKHKKKNRSSWLAWSSWGGSVTGKKSRGKKKEETTSAAAESSSKTAHVGGDESVRSSVRSEPRGKSIWDDDIDEDSDNAGNASEESSRSRASLDADGLRDNLPEQDNGVFDWELQRRIWEEQERQMRMGMTGAGAAEMEFATIVVLGIGIEVTGLRIEEFVEQDTAIPVAPVTKFYVHAEEDQRAIAIRVYEFEKKKKSLPRNVHRRKKKYPKLLGEIELPWQNARSPGTVQFGISVEVLVGGDVLINAAEKLNDGTLGVPVTLHIPRSALCTMQERLKMEADSQQTTQKEQLLALPAPETGNGNISGQLLALPAPPAAEQKTLDEQLGLSETGKTSVTST